MAKKDKKSKKNKKDGSHKDTKIGTEVENKIYTTPILYPDSRFIKTNTTCPSMSNVIRERNWSEYDRL